MVDFKLSAEQMVWKEKARKFTAENVIPRTDLDTHGHFPIDLYQKAFDEGFFTSTLPNEFGGTGRSLFETVLATEEFAYGDLGVTTSTFLLKLATGSILNFGTEVQKEKWIRPLTQKLQFASFAWSEPQGSSNLVVRPASTTARPVEGGYLLNGVKSTISNANVASIYTVFARIEGARIEGSINEGFSANASESLSCFVVPRSAQGLSVSNPYRKMGQRAADTGEITFTNVFVPTEDQIGKPGQGIQIAFRSVLASRVGIGAMAVGVARRARDLVKKYGHSRMVNPRTKLIQQQDYRFQIAQIETEIEMVRALVWRACWGVETGTEAIKLSSCAKLAGGSMASRVTNQALEMLGAQGYLESGLIEKLVRDSKVLQIYEGTEAIQKMLIADTATRLGSLRNA